jgi:hypothetical protein
MFLFFIRMMLLGNMHYREDEDDAVSDLFFEDGKCFEEDEGNEGESECEDINKPDSTPLWKYVTKLEGGGRGCGTTVY